MATDDFTTIPGIVRNGVVVPQSDATLREGTHVEIVVASSGVPPELLAEIAAWDRASDEAWAMIDQWESEPQDRSGVAATLAGHGLEYRRCRTGRARGT